MNANNKNRWPFIGLILAFVVPVLAAKLVLSMNWYQGGVTNQGELLPHQTNYQSYSMENPQPKRWQLAYLLPQHCDSQCQQHLYILKQSHTALGKHQQTVSPIVLVQPNSDISALNNYSFKTYTASSQLAEQLGYAFVVVDPLGTLVMGYPKVTGEQASKLQGKAMVKDIRKMLKLSRLG